MEYGALGENKNIFCLICVWKEENGLFWLFCGLPYFEFDITCLLQKMRRAIISGKGFYQENMG